MSEADYYDESGDAMSVEDHEDTLPTTEPDMETETKPKPKQKRKAKPLKYPEGIERLTRKGKGTWAKGCGPLPDNTEWSSIDFNVLKEQVSMRGRPQSGTRGELIKYLTEYKEHGSSALSARNNMFSDVHVKNATRVQEERMYILNWSDTSNGTIHSASFTVCTEGKADDPYYVEIQHLPRCTCPATRFYGHSVCKHALYILTWILKVSKPLISKTDFTTQDLAAILEPVLGPPSDKFIMPADRKELAGEDCPVCFKDLSDGAATTQCLECSATTHTRCFNQYTEMKSGWQKHSVACVLCGQPWTLPGPWGKEALNIENVAIAESKIAEKAALRAEKAAARAAEKAAIKEAKEVAKAEQKAKGKKSKN